MLFIKGKKYILNIGVLFPKKNQEALLDLISKKDHICAREVGGRKTRQSGQARKGAAVTGYFGLSNLSLKILYCHPAFSGFISGFIFHKKINSLLANFLQ